MDYDQVFEALSEWDTAIREKGATLEQIEEALDTLRDLIKDEMAQRDE
jgi:hypothetical protein